MSTVPLTPLQAPLWPVCMSRYYGQLEKTDNNITSEKIEERERLMKMKTGIKKEEMERANRILEKYLEWNSDMCKMSDNMYAMAARRDYITPEMSKGKENKD